MLRSQIHGVLLGVVRDAFTDRVVETNSFRVGLVRQRVELIVSTKCNGSDNIRLSTAAASLNHYRLIARLHVRAKALNQGAKYIGLERGVTVSGVDISLSPGSLFCI